MIIIFYIFTFLQNLSVGWLIYLFFESQVILLFLILEFTYLLFILVCVGTFAVFFLFVIWMLRVK